MVYAARNRKVGLGRAMNPVVCCMGSGGAQNIGLSICRSVCEKVKAGVPNHCAEEGSEVGDLRSPWVSRLVLFPGPNHGSLSNYGGVQTPGVLVQPGQFAQTHPKGLPEWMAKPSSLGGVLFPGSCKTCLRRWVST